MNLKTDTQKSETWLNKFIANLDCKCTTNYFFNIFHIFCSLTYTASDKFLNILVPIHFLKNVLLHSIISVLHA